MNPFYAFGILAMAYAAIIMRHERRAKALAITGFLYVILGTLIEVMP